MKTEKLSLRERVGFWLCHRAPWDLNYMTCGTLDKLGKHLWQADTYSPDDCPMCKLRKEIACLTSKQ